MEAKRENADSEPWATCHLTVLLEFSTLQLCIACSLPALLPPAPRLSPGDPRMTEVAQALMTLHGTKEECATTTVIQGLVFQVWREEAVT